MSNNSTNEPKKKIVKVRKKRIAKLSAHYFVPELSFFPKEELKLNSYGRSSTYVIEKCVCGALYKAKYYLTLQDPNRYRAYGSPPPSKPPIVHLNAYKPYSSNKCMACKAQARQKDNQYLIEVYKKRLERLINTPIKETKEDQKFTETLIAYTNAKKINK